MTMKAKCEALVIALVGKEHALGWWNSPNRAFDNQTPLETDISRVYEYLLDYYGR